jgi:predicted secreted protein
MRHQLSAADNGKIVPVRCGDSIDLKLNEMPSGGYRWLLDGYPEEILEFVDQQFDYAEGRVGGSNETCFRFRVEAPGSGTVRLSYRRSWETGQASLESYQLAIQSTEA